MAKKEKQQVSLIHYLFDQLLDLERQEVAWWVQSIKTEDFLRLTTYRHLLANYLISDMQPYGSDYFIRDKCIPQSEVVPYLLNQLENPEAEN